MRHVLLIPALLIVTLIGAYACFIGDTPENDSLLNGDAGLTGPLLLSFESELAVAYGKVTKPMSSKEVLPADRLKAVDAIGELIKAELVKAGRPDAEQDAALILQEMRDYLDGEKAFGETKPAAKVAASRLPDCYQLYLGSLTPDRAKALEATEALLALPPDQRRPLGAVAHYRRGRLLEHFIRNEDARTQAGKELTLERLRVLRQSLEAVQTAIKEGSPDVASVGAAARGWLADSYSRLPMECGEMLRETVDLRKAADLYLGLRAEGEVIGEVSLRSLMCGLSESQAGLELCRDDKELRRLMTMFLSSHRETWIEQEEEPPRDKAIEEWLRVLNSGNLAEPDENTVRIALLYYQRGDYDASERLVAKCPPGDVAAAMLRSRLELRLGRRVEAAKALERALPGLGKVEAFPQWGLDDRLWETWEKSWVFVKRDQTNSADGKLRAELAMLRLGLGDFADALRLNLAAGLIWDARYVAECVMSVDELKAFVDAEVKGPHVRKRGYLEWAEPGDTIDLNEEIRVLLGRRLCRAGRWTEAKPYMRPGMAAQIDAYLGHLDLARDTTKDSRTRADAYWQAALLIRAHGRELLYCDFGPRHTAWLWTPTGAVRGWVENNWPRCRAEPSQTYPWNPLTGPGTDERRRIEAWLAENPAPGNRHNVLMKYRAFDLGMKAVELLPDNDPSGGMILQHVGSELMYLDPPFANKAYKLLATRFKETPFGKYAAEKHWFMLAERPLASIATWVRNPPVDYTPPVASPKAEDEGK